MNEYFVMLNHPSVNPVPMVDESEEIAWFSSTGEAKKVAGNSSLGETFGFTIYEKGNGVENY